MCELCIRELKTRKYYCDKDVWIVDDLNPRDFDLRVLAVWKEHVLFGSLSDERREYLISKLWEVYEEYLKDDYKTSGLDTTHYSIPDHEHVQLCLTRKEK